MMDERARMSVAPPSKGLAGLVDNVTAVSTATDTVGGKLEEDKEEVATMASEGFQVPRSGTWVEDGGRVVGLEVVGPVVEPVRAEGEKGGVVGGVVGVAFTGAPAVDVVGGMVLVEEEERAREEGEGVVPVEEGEGSSVDALGASSESVVTVINHS